MKSVVCYPDGIYMADSGHGSQPRLAAAYFIVDHGRVAVIDTGSNASVPHILAALAGLDIAPEMVDWVILTHLHLDRVGGAGSLMCALPHARVAVHPGDALYLADPAALWEKTVAVYGAEQTFRLYGRLTPLDEHRIVATHDGMTLPLGERTLRVFDAPGHTRRHIVIWDELACAFFTGDAFGVSYREFDVGGRSFVFPTTASGQFDPDAMLGSIERMLAHGPQQMFLAHYGRVAGVERLAGDLCRLIHAQVALARAAHGSGIARHVQILAGLDELVREECARQRWAVNEKISLNLLRPDLDLNAQGLGGWLDARQDAAALDAFNAQEDDLAEAAVA
ncbi:MAG: MBL fold metallo-hydrolase [Azoarcus sp.]|nr:MBL fold metallo-hydrolase [Azoarcus sp.]